MVLMEQALAEARVRGKTLQPTPSDPGHCHLQMEANLAASTVEVVGECWWMGRGQAVVSIKEVALGEEAVDAVPLGVVFRVSFSSRPNKVDIQYTNTHYTTVLYNFNLPTSDD